MNVHIADIAFTHQIINVTLIKIKTQPSLACIYFYYLFIVDYSQFSAKPSKPEGPLDVSDIHKDGCTLKWRKPKDDGGEPIEGYLVEKYDPETGVWLPVGKCAGTEMKVDGLTPGHEYKFRVKAINSEGESEPLETYGSIIAKDPFSTFYTSIKNLFIP